MNDNQSLVTANLIGLKRQLGLGHYQFLTHPTNPRLIQARNIEMMALAHPDLPDVMRMK